MGDSQSFFEVSVQGTIFRLNKERCLSHDWLLSRMLTSGVPHETVHGLPYLDVDPISFRVILSVMQGTTDLGLEVSRISSAELALLRATARYLLCNEIEEQIGAIVSEHEAELSALQKELDAEKARSQAERDARAQMPETLKALEGMPKSVVRCKGYRQSRRFNVCGSGALLIGGVVTKEGKISCVGCNKECDLNGDSFGTWKIESSPAAFATMVRNCEKSMEPYGCGIAPFQCGARV